MKDNIVSFREGAESIVARKQGTVMSEPGVLPGIASPQEGVLVPNERLVSRRVAKKDAYDVLISVDKKIDSLAKGEDK